MDYKCIVGFFCKTVGKKYNVGDPITAREYSFIDQKGRDNFAEVYTPEELISMSSIGVPGVPDFVFVNNRPKKDEETEQ